MGIVRKGVLRAALVAGLCAAAPGAQASFTIVLSATDWAQALSGPLSDEGLVARRLRIADALFFDAAGGDTPYRDPSETAWVSETTGGERTLLRARSAVFGDRLPVRMEGDDLVGSFACYSPVWPCLGVVMAELVFPQPVRGLAGSLRYFFGDDAWLWGETAMIEPFRSGWRQLNGGELALPSETLAGQWDTFFGVLFFDEPVTRLRFSWRENAGGLDGEVWFRLAGAIMLVEPVPEPASLALVAVALLGLAAARFPLPLGVTLPLRLGLRSPT